MSDSTSDPNQQSSPPPDPAPRVLRSEDLFAGQKLIIIEHAGEPYRLLITRNDRLLLQK